MGCRSGDGCGNPSPGRRSAVAPCRRIANKGGFQMRTLFRMVMALVSAALIGMLAGCAGGTNQTSTAPPQTKSGATATSSAATGAGLGTAAAAGPFKVTLTSVPAAPKVGETRFQAQVTRDGQPVKNATVTVSLSMPSMDMGGPETTLKAAGEQYAGTANLGMGGEYQAKTTVTAGGDTGTAHFHFMASQ